MPPLSTASARSAFAKATDESPAAVTFVFGCQRSPPSVETSTMPPLPTASARLGFAKATDPSHAPSPRLFSVPVLAFVG